MNRAERLSKIASVPRMLAEIVVMEANRRDVSLAELRHSGRDRHDLIQIRWEIAAVARSHRLDDKPRFSLPEIGRALNRDHTTVLHGLRKVQAK